MDRETKDEKVGGLSRSRGEDWVFIYGRRGLLARPSDFADSSLTSPATRGPLSLCDLLEAATLARLALLGAAAAHFPGTCGPCTPLKTHAVLAVKRTKEPAVAPISLALSENVEAGAPDLFACIVGAKGKEEFALFQVPCHLTIRDSSLALCRWLLMSFPSFLGLGSLSPSPSTSTSPLSPSLVFPFPWTRLEMMLSHVPFILRSHLFFFPFPFPFLLFSKLEGPDVGADAYGCPFQMELGQDGQDGLDDLRWDTASIHWPKKKDVSSPAARHFSLVNFAGYRRVPVCEVAWHVAYVAVGTADWLGWQTESRRASIRQSRTSLPSLSSISPIPSHHLSSSTGKQRQPTGHFRLDGTLLSIVSFRSPDSCPIAYTSDPNGHTYQIRTSSKKLNSESLKLLPPT